MLFSLGAICASLILPHVTYTARVPRDTAHTPQNVRSAHAQDLRHRATTDTKQVAGKHFDFVIVGGGVAGLAIASRLSEWSNTTVLVIEAGTDGSTVQDQIDIPGKSYLDGLAGKTIYDWQYVTTAQDNADGNPRTWPRGKGLGGSGAINGAFFCRGSKADYDAWDTLQGDDSSKISWGWDVMLKYMMKAENFTPMTDDQAKTFSVTHDPSVHGTSGPIHASYSRYQFPLLSTWVPTLSKLGLMPNPDAAGGSGRGASFVTSTINPTNSSRSDSKAGYIISTGASSRKNLVILTENQAVRLIWNDTSAGHATVGGVVFAASAGSPEKTVYADKEVILAGGVVGSAQLLQLSGVGPKAHLDTLKIDSVVDLPGVGANLQDHASTSVYFESTADPTWVSLADPDFAAAELKKWQADGSGMWSYLNEATAYPATVDLFGATEGPTWASGVKSGLTDALAATKKLNAMDDTVARGVQAQYAIQADMAASDTEGQVEIIFNMLGQNVGSIGIQVAVQRAFSRGTVLINSASAFDPPEINPNYFSNAWDMDIMKAGIGFLTKIGQTQPLADQIKSQRTPAPDSTDSAIESYLRSSIATEYHPCGSCSMQPLANGGVVNTSLVVYGTTNLRVADASIMPLNIAAHLMASTYGIAEHASDLIKATYAKIETSTSSSASPSGTGSDADANETGGAHSGPSSRLSTGAKAGIGAGVGVAALVGLFAALAFLRRRSQNRAIPVATSDPAVVYNDESHSGSSTPNIPLAPFMQSGARGSYMSTGQSSLASALPDQQQQVSYDNNGTDVVPSNSPTPGQVSQPYRD